MSTADLPTYDAGYVPFAGMKSWADSRLDGQTWLRYDQRLKQARIATTPKDVDSDIIRSLLAAAVNTGAIEGLHNSDRGLTLTVVEHAVEWEQHVRNAEGEEAEEHVRAGLHAFDMALDAATGNQEISEAWIRRLHEVACASQETVTFETPLGRQVQPFVKGRYKTRPNHVRQADGSVHSYCPVDDVPIQMKRLVDELRSPTFKDAHPVVQTAFSHHALTNIHPFQDGNGRVARALASVFLLKAASIPLVIYPDQAVSYFKALELADVGEYQPFVDFAFDRAVDMLAFAADLAVGSGPLEAVMPKDRTPTIVIEAANRLPSLVERQIRETLKGVNTSDGIEVQLSTMGFTHGARDSAGRRTITGQHPMVEATVKEYGLSLNRWFPIFAGVDESTPFAVSLCNNTTDDCVEFRLQEIHPEVTTAAGLKLSAFVHRVTADLFDELNSELDRR